MMDDLISRQAAIDAVKFGITYAKVINKFTGEAKELFKEGNKALNEAAERLKELPSAQPPWNPDEWCHDCKEYDKEKHCCPRWNRVIRNALKEAQPRKGKWTRHFDGNEWYWYCSSCKEQWYEEDLWMGGNSFPNFCPNCGCRMEEGDSE